MHKLTQIACLAALAAGTALAPAGVITWGAATNVTAATNVSTTGRLVFARAEGSATVSSTVNGVTFAPANTLGSANNGQLKKVHITDLDFKRLLDNIGSGGGPDLVTYDLGALTLGQTYEIQVFFVDQRYLEKDRVMRFGSTDGKNTGGTVDLEADPDNRKSAPWGQYAIGTFTVDADGAPDLTLDAQGFENAHITAVQLRAVGPEPSSAALLSLGGLKLILLPQK